MSGRGQAEGIPGASCTDSAAMSEGDIICADSTLKRQPQGMAAPAGPRAQRFRQVVPQLCASSALSSSFCSSVRRLGSGAGAGPPSMAPAARTARVSPRNLAQTRPRPPAAGYSRLGALPPTVGCAAAGCGDPPALVESGLISAFPLSTSLCGNPHNFAGVHSTACLNITRSEVYCGKSSHARGTNRAPNNRPDRRGAAHDASALKFCIRQRRDGGALAERPLLWGRAKREQARHRAGGGQVAADPHGGAKSGDHHADTWANCR